MEYSTLDNKILIFDKSQFCPKHIMECGQLFRFWFDEKTNSYKVVSGNRLATLVEYKDRVEVETDDIPYFINYFDLDRDYNIIKEKIKDNVFVKTAIDSCEGLRILRQDLLETIISFIVSANNNIKRIKLILNRMAENAGENMGDYFAFPTYEQLKDKDENFFASIGAGYRAKYLKKFLIQYKDFKKANYAVLATDELRKKLIELAGVGPKVADCILLFAYNRTDSFPVDTWMEKAYFDFFCKQKRTRPEIAKYFVKKYGDLSGFAQQYLFYYKSNKLS